jgi:hypothetical protein
MSYSLFFLAGAWLASAGGDSGGVPQPLPIGPPQATNVAPLIPSDTPAASVTPPKDPHVAVIREDPMPSGSSQVISSRAPQEEKGGMLSRWHHRLGGLFHRTSRGSTTTPVQTVPVSPTTVPAGAVSPQSLGPTSSSRLTPVAYTGQGKGAPEVSSRFRDKVGHEKDYSWITGQLFHLPDDGGTWVLRYTTPETVDKYNGSVVLHGTTDMKGAQAGDLVSVRGQVASDGSSSGKQPGGAVYHMTEIGVIERAGPAER